MRKPISTELVRDVLAWVGGLSAGVYAGLKIGGTAYSELLPRAIGISAGVFLILGLVNALRPRFPQVVCSSRIFALLVVLVFSAIFASSISAPAERHSHFSMAGFIPYSDANSYFWQAVNWPQESFSSVNSLRPLNVALNILEFRLGGSTLLGTLLLRVALVSLAVAAFTLALAEVLGRPVALGCGLALAYWTWPWAAIMMSEISGITVSTAAFALLLAGLHRMSPGFLVWGVLAMVLASSLRTLNPVLPPFFAFAVCLCWSGSALRRLGRAVLAGFATVLAIGVLTSALALAYGHPESSPQGNISQTLLGLVRGTNWEEATDYLRSKQPELTERSLPAAAISATWQVLKDDPRKALEKISHNASYSFFRLPSETGMALGAREATSRLRTGLYWMLALAALMFGWRPYAPVVLLLALSLVMFLATAPLVISDAGWRVFATLYPGFALWVACPAVLLRAWRTRGRVGEDTSRRSTHARAPLWPAQTVVVVAVAAAFFPWFLQVCGATPASHTREPVLRMVMEDTGRSRWIDGRTSIVPRAQVRVWFEKCGFESWAAFWDAHGHKITEIRNEVAPDVSATGIYTLVTDDPSVESARPGKSDLEKWAPFYFVRPIQ